MREFNIHFQSITSSLGSFKLPESSDFLNEPDPIKSIVNKYKNYPSIKKIKSKYITVKHFSFWPVTAKDVLDVIFTLANTKSSGEDIPNPFQTFPDPLKLEEITPIHKEEDPFDKDNYRPMSTLHLMSIYSQVYGCIQQHMNPLLCRFRQGRGTQHALFCLLQAWQKEFFLL